MQLRPTGTCAYCLGADIVVSFTDFYLVHRLSDFESQGISGTDISAPCPTPALAYGKKTRQEATRLYILFDTRTVFVGIASKFATCVRDCPSPFYIR